GPAVAGVEVHEQEVGEAERREQVEDDQDDHQHGRSRRRGQVFTQDVGVIVGLRHGMWSGCGQGGNGLLTWSFRHSRGSGGGFQENYGAKIRAARQKGQEAPVLPNLAGTQLLPSPQRGEGRSWPRLLFYASCGGKDRQDRPVSYILTSRKG